MRRLLLISPLVFLALFNIAHGFSSNCRVLDDNDEDNVTPDGETATLECTFDDDPESCTWSHIEPMHEGKTNDADITCSAGKDQNGQNCQEDSRIQYSFSGSKCSIQISDSQPEDTGKWKIAAVGFDSSGGKVRNSSFEFEKNELKSCLNDLVFI